MFIISCNKKEKIAKEESLKTEVSVNKPEEKPKDDLVNHFFQANGGSVLYLKNGEIKSCAKCDFDGDFVSEFLKTKTQTTYKDYENFVVAKGNDTMKFFDEFGKIISGWKILKQIPIENEMSVISYTSSPKNAKNVQTINETALLIIQPELKKFKDENSEEAENYFIAMDDWNWYSHELSEYFETLKIKTIYLKNNFISLTIEDQKNITIDTQKLINGSKVYAILYKKNKRPILVNLIPNDNDKDLINQYLKN